MSDETTLEREAKSPETHHSFSPLKKALIITFEDEGVLQRNGLTIELISIWKWVLEL